LNTYNGVANIRSKDGSSKVIAQSQAMNPLSKPIEVIVVRKRTDEFYELVFVHEMCVLGREEYVSC
jgi:hypothetical protein